MADVADRTGGGRMRIAAGLTKIPVSTCLCRKPNAFPFARFPSSPHCQLRESQALAKSHSIMKRPQKIFAAVLSVFVVLVLGHLSRGQNPDLAAGGWKAGAASTVITPKTLMWMAGYASRTKPAEGVDTDLFAKALVLEDDEGSLFALVTADLVSVPRDVRLDTAARVAEQWGIAPERLVINVSHTHCGPELRTWRTYKTDEPDQREREAGEYGEWVAETFTRIVGEALASRQQAEVSYGHSRCGFAMNRRRPTPEGFKNMPNSEGPVDHRVPVLQVRAKEGGGSLAVVFGYACHCTTLNHQRFNGDYAGYAQDFVEKAHPGAVALFVNGCSGDQNPYPRRKFEYAEVHGRTLALAVESALDTELLPLSGSLRAALPTRAELEVRAKSSDKLDAQLAVHLLGRLDAGESLPEDYPYPVQVARLGDQLTLVALGGEVVVDYSLRLQEEIADPVVWVAGYSNDVMTYIPSLRVWEEGGYEGGSAMKHNHFPSRWHPEVEEVIVRTVHELRAELP
jgi:neutral ceramidase